MTKNIIWTGKRYTSTEHCSITAIKNGYEINGVIIGVFDNKIVKAQYMIVTDHQWQTTSFHTCFFTNGKREEFLYRSDGKGNWRDNTEAKEHLKGCIDIDISLTPFTNTLPVKRLQLKENEQQEIAVVYIDLLHKEVYKFNQRYTRIADDKYLYQNLDNTFEALLTVNKWGLVTDYPGIFVMDKIEEP